MYVFYHCKLEIRGIKTVSPVLSWFGFPCENSLPQELDEEYYMHEPDILLYTPLDLNVEQQSTSRLDHHPLEKKEGKMGKLRNGLDGGQSIISTYCTFISFPVVPL
jgi:hypothetical protein